jgi:hypothetical protein
VRDTRIFNNKPSIECSQQEAMKIRNTILTLTFALVAGIGCDADRDPAPAADVSIDSEIELAQPQPQVPLCSRCGVSTELDTTFGNDELSIDIDNAFNGTVSSVTLTTWDSTGKSVIPLFPQHQHGGDGHQQPLHRRDHYVRRSHDRRVGPASLGAHRRDDDRPHPGQLMAACTAGSVRDDSPSSHEREKFGSAQSPV